MPEQGGPSWILGGVCGDSLATVQVDLGEVSPARSSSPECPPAVL